MAPSVPGRVWKKSKSSEGSKCWKLFGEELAGFELRSSDHYVTTQPLAPTHLKKLTSKSKTAQQHVQIVQILDSKFLAAIHFPHFERSVQLKNEINAWQLFCCNNLAALVARFFSEWWELEPERIEIIVAALGNHGIRFAMMGRF